MSLNFCSFSSGSSGNCYLVKTENTALLVDAGISGKKIFEGLQRTGTPMEQVAGILITHEHIDHVRSLKTVAKKAQDIKAYANQGTWACISQMVALEKQECFITGSRFFIGDIEVRAFATSHDAAEPVGFSFFNEDKQISIVTDTGCMSEKIFEEIKTADILVLEANHEVGLLQYCKYPFSVKRRILGDKGHLSNVAAGECLCNLMRDSPKERRVLLAHLSRENNTPAMAKLAIKSMLEEAHFYIGKNLDLDIIVRDEVSAIYQL